MQSVYHNPVYGGHASFS